MKKEVDQYTYRVTWSEEDQDHVGFCAEFPSLSWLHSSPEKALVGIRKLVNNILTDATQPGASLSRLVSSKPN